MAGGPGLKIYLQHCDEGYATYGMVSDARLQLAASGP